ncbi:MAG: ABC transporter permease [Actinomycetota bacterium]
MKKFSNLFSQDFKIIIRSGFHYAVIALAVLFIAATNFALPESLDITPPELFLDDTEGRIFEKPMLDLGFENNFFTSYHEFEQELHQSREGMGIIAAGSPENISFEIISSSALGHKTLNIVQATLQYITDLVTQKDTGSPIKIEYLRDRTKPMPFNISFIPIFITFEVVMLGFILIAVLIFQEKGEGSIRAYRVSAGGVHEYILSKAIIISLLGLAYGLVCTLLTAGLGINYFWLAAIVMLAGLLMTFFGLFMSVFFKNISEFLIVSVTVMVLVQLPVISYFNPSFIPAFIRWLPSYPVLFGIREIIYPSGKAGFLLPLFAILGIEALAAYIGCYWAVKIRLMKAGRKI